MPSSQVSQTSNRVVQVGFISAVLAMVVIAASPPADLSRYFAGGPPLLIAVLILSMGAILLPRLQTNFGLMVFRAPLTGLRLLTATLAAVPFMLIITLIDLTLPFPADLNVQVPAALLFYPVMGLLAEIALHIVPFAIALWLLSFTTKWRLTGIRTGIAIVCSALPESAFHMLGTVGDGAMTLQAALVGAHLFLFGLAEIQLYRKFDFATMYLFRLSYYAYWHVIWGLLRT